MNCECLWASHLKNASAKLKTLKRNDINKFFDKINKNVGINWAPVWTRPSGRAGDSGRDTFEKQNIIKCKIKELNGLPRCFDSDSPARSGRVGLGVLHTCQHIIQESLNIIQTITQASNAIIHIPRLRHSVSIIQPNAYNYFHLYHTYVT